MTFMLFEAPTKSSNKLNTINKQIASQPATKSLQIK